MVDEPDAGQVVELGKTRWIIAPEPELLDSYVLLDVESGSPLSAPFTRKEALQFAQDLLRWVRAER